jgi:hypothetical protein
VNVTFWQPSKRFSTGGFIHMKNLVMFLGAVLFVGAAACSSSSDAASSAASGNCPAVGSKVCSADDAVTQDEADECVKDKNDATCGAKYTAALECEGSNAKCGSDNKLDGASLLAACSTQLQAYSDCTTPSTTGDGGS